MSGAEAIAVLGLISSIISIVDGTKKVYDAATDTKGLPQAFREVAGRLPIVESILGYAEQDIGKGKVNNDSCKGVKHVVEACEEKAKRLEELFHKAIPAEGASDLKRYYKAVKALGRGNEVEKLMKGILEEVQLLACERGMNTATNAQQQEIVKAITEVSAISPSVPENEVQETGFTNKNYGSGTQYNARGEIINQGSARQWNAPGGTMNFGDIYNKTQYISNPRPNEDEAQACLSALFLTDPRDDRAKLINDKGSRVEGTCQWIKSHTRYTSWLSSPSQLLWLSGGPGKGKTMLSIFLAEELEETAISQNKLFLQYFCDNKDEKRNTAVAVLRGLIYQILQSRPKLFDHILPDFKVQKTSLFSFEALWRIFENMVGDSALESSYCVLDGLDECDEVSLKTLLEKFAARFSKTDRLSPCHLNLLVVSRGLPDFIPSLLSDFPRISLDPDASGEIKHDIDKFIEEKVKELSRHRDYSKGLHVHVTKVFRERAQGTFLWIGIVAKELGKYKATEVEEALKTFPPGLDELYARILRQIASGRREIAARILRWVVMAVRPLSLLELSFAIEPTVDTSIVDDRDERIRDQILYCGDFLMIKGDEVGLIHQSAKDYLLRKDKDQIPELEDFRVKEDVANDEIAKRCLDYLQSGALKNSKPYVLSDDEHLSRFPLLSYAVLHWHEHARSTTRLANVFDLSHPFWKKESEIRTSWLKAYWHSEFIYHRNTPPESFTKLHLASSFGILSLVEKLVLREGWTNKIKRWHYLEKVDSQGMTALMWAVKHEHEAVVRLLLKKGANINVKTSTSETVLMTVAAWGCEAVIHLLLKQGANIKSQDRSGHTALMNAAEAGHKNIVKLLLDQGADTKVQDRGGKTALMKAAGKGHEAVTQLLLDQGADTKVQDRGGKTALMKAAGKGHEAVTKLLLQQGADIEVQNESGGTALMRAAEGGRESVVHLLLQQGADINVQDSHRGETALMKAAGKGYEAVTQLLLDQGADTKVQDRGRKTALIKAAGKGHEAVTQLLLDQGADTEVQDIIGQTALMKAAISGFEDSGAVVRLLLENGADIDAKDDNGETALMKAAEGWSKNPEALIRLLLENGADIDAKDDYGETALMRAAESWTEGIGAAVRLLLENGADIDAKKNNGETALMKAAEGWSENPEALIRLLLENGADIDATNDDGNTALMKAAVSGFENSGAVVRLLLENGADVKAKNENGETALMIAAESSSMNSEATVQLLLEKGADINAENNNGDTALAIAVRKREEAEDGTLMNSFLEYEPESEAKRLVEVRKSNLESVILAFSLYSQTKSSI